MDNTKDVLEQMLINEKQILLKIEQEKDRQIEAQIAKIKAIQEKVNKL